MTELELHEQALQFITGIIDGVPKNMWAAQSPCDEWTVRDVTNHIVAENLWAEPLMEGVTVEQVGDRFDGDVLGGDPRSAWHKAGEIASTAFNADGAMRRQVHVSWGDISAREYLSQMTTDLIVHAWDIGSGSGQPVVIPDALAKFAYDCMTDLVASGQGGSVFKKPVEIVADASLQDQTIALTGRMP